MLRRSILSLALALAAILALAMPALAGGVVVTLDSTPTDVQAGAPFTVGFMIISAHEGHLPITDGKPIILATNAATKERVTANAKAEGEPGHYVATLTLPSAGKWEWSIHPWGELNYPTAVLSPIEVRAAAAQAVPAAENASASQTSLDAALWPALVAIVAGGAIAAAVLVRLRRRAEARS